eukprot:GHVO01040528.1.p1 GENE.GHVO01040528.1~~GHVO01040528.1.p1  ORF type:complete len:165 (+),score=27.87 GHVO01040528.1:30-524(+)
MVDDSELQVDASGASGASATYPTAAGNIKKGYFCMLKGRPCKVVEYTTSKTGKHGHAKAHIVGLDIFTSKKLEDICPTSHNLDVPNVKRVEYQVLDCEDGFVTLLTEGGDLKADLTLPSDSEGNPDDVAKQLQNLLADGKSVLATVVSACGTEKICAVKEIAAP